jgi:dinuclear metal center YbgI/SA1388 family protein
MNINTLVKKLEKFAPVDLAKKDHVGIIIDGGKVEIRKIGLTLDANLKNIKTAAKEKCDFLISHHGPDEAKFEEIEGLDAKRINLALSNNLTVYRWHLCLDSCKNGIEDQLCKILGFKKFKRVPVKYKGEKLPAAARIVEGNYTLKDLISKVKRLKPNSLRYIDSGKRIYKRIAITSGEGFVPSFLEQLNPNAFISGQLEHITIIRALDLGITLIEATHASTEDVPLKLIAPVLAKLLNLPVIHIPTDDRIQVVHLEGGKTKC